MICIDLVVSGEDKVIKFLKRWATLFKKLALDIHVLFFLSDCNLLSIHIIAFLTKNNIMDELMGLIAKERNYPCLSNVVEDEYGGILRTSHAQNTEKDCGGFEALELRPETPDLNTHHEDPDFIWSEIYTWMLQVSEPVASRLVESNLLYLCLILTAAASLSSSAAAALCFHAPFSTDCRHMRFKERMYLLCHVILSKIC